MLRSEIMGFVNMKSCLSGMPVLKLGLNDKLFFELTGRSIKFDKILLKIQLLFI
jgi:AP-1 complex subunit mu